MGNPPLRLVRASVFAAVCVSLTSLGHLTAARAPMPLWTVGAGFLGVLAFAWLLAGHERGLPTIFGGLAGGQFTLHALFAEGGHLHHGGEELAEGSGGRPGMTLAHLLAALVSSWWLRRGESGIWRLARRLLLRLAPLLHPIPAVRPRPLPAVPDRVRVLRAAVLRHVLFLRGPPVILPAR
ncbi:MFS transporter [Actinocorallia longicatena]|uniref:MFS transporter n=1 Tax=Actinocorallia longicatena TaxID=111803 RepID=A0ABP6Q327_9ACTN